MAYRIEVRCINKTNRLSRDEAISNIGGINPDGRPWVLSEKEAIEGIEAGKWEFYTRPGGYEAEVLVWRTHDGHKFLRTGRDNSTADNLLSLPECP